MQSWLINNTDEILHQCNKLQHWEQSLIRSWLHNLNVINLWASTVQHFRCVHYHLKTNFNQTGICDNIQWNSSILNSMKIYSLILEQLNADRKPDRHSEAQFHNFLLGTNPTHFTLTNSFFAILELVLYLILCLMSPRIKPTYYDRRQQPHLNHLHFNKCFFGKCF